MASERVLPAIESSTDLDGLHVLVVDDEADARELLSAIFAGKGANVSSARDATEALALFESRTPDVVVSDIELPGMDGCALIRRLRERAGDVPAIAVSGFAGPRDCERAVGAGFDLHVAKPVEARDLVKCVHDLTSRRQRRV